MAIFPKLAVFHYSSPRAGRLVVSLCLFERIAVEDAGADDVSAVLGAAAALDDARGAPDLHAGLPLHQGAAVHRHRHRHARAGGAALDLK